ncbi:MAG: BrnT family toxin [Planctomycetota bacterium]
MDPKFERCASKNAANLRKHGVAFDEAASAFQDPFARVFDDLDHSTKESRELLVGYSDRRLLVVAFTTREGRVRVISARRATYRERKIHEEEIQ